jgi:uncharacterized protein (UPF0333 family)
MGSHKECVRSVKMRRNAQSVIEYSIGVAVVVAALIAMVTYTKRGLNGRFKDVVDSAAKAANNTTQYEPYYQQSDLEIKANKNISQDIKENGARLTGFNDTVNVTGNITYPLANE